jgi:hypothetical protein
MSSQCCECPPITVHIRWKTLELLTAKLSGEQLFQNTLIARGGYWLDGVPLWGLKMVVVATLRQSRNFATSKAQLLYHFSFLGGG